MLMLNTHPYISTGLKENKFGVGVDEAREVYKLAATLPHVKLRVWIVILALSLLNYSPS